eukprot:GHVN01042246.1.p1 GENE.GHVN01042246.1~~GHVN01042246.1.p1  ORF type:complete len:351 (+),score=56.77 GHVN01042246.1:185-1237(+)
MNRSRSGVIDQRHYQVHVKTKSSAKAKSSNTSLQEAFHQFEPEREDESENYEDEGGTQGRVEVNYVSGKAPVPLTEEEKEERALPHRMVSTLNYSEEQDDDGEEEEGDEQYETDLGHYLRECCRPQMEAIENVEVTIILPGSHTRNVELMFDYYNYRLMFGRKIKSRKTSRFYPLTHIETWSDDPKMVRKVIEAEVSHGGDETQCLSRQEAPDLILDVDTMCTLTMKGLAAPLLFQFSTPELKSSFVTVMSYAIEFLQMPGFKGEAADTVAPYVDRANTLRTMKTERLATLKALKSLVAVSKKKPSVATNEDEEDEEEDDGVDHLGSRAARRGATSLKIGYSMRDKKQEK